MLPCGTREYVFPTVSILLAVVLASASCMARIERPRESRLDAERQIKQKTETNAYKFEEGKCVFYCFHISDNKYAIISNETVALYKEHTRCSHMLYGEAEIDHRNEIHPPSIYDSNDPDMDIANFKKLKKLSDSVKLMLSVRVGTHASWVEDEWKHEIVAANLVNVTRMAEFSGVFLRLHSEHLYSVEIEHFFEELSKQRAADAQRRFDNSSLTVVLTVSAEWAPHVTERLKNIHPHLSAVYLLSDETSSGNADSTSYSRLYGEPFVAVPVDPLSVSSTVLAEDTIRYNAGLAALEKARIPREKIVIGLSTWTRSYIVDKKATEAVKNADSVVADEIGGSPVSSFFRNSTGAVMVWRRGAGGPVTRRRDGRLSYFETCKISGFQNATVAEGSASAYFLGVEPTDTKGTKVGEEALDESAEVVPMFNQEVVDNQRFSMDNRAQEFYSFNAPENRSMAVKLKWVAGKGYGGVGLDNLQGDDAGETCGSGVLPLHNYLADHFQCTATRRTTERRGTAASAAAMDGPNNRCVRICIVDTNHRTAKNPTIPLMSSFDGVDPAWCTHVVISPLYVMKTGRLAKKSTFGQLIDAYNSWKRPNRPYLVLSIGGDQKAIEWRSALSSPNNRRTLINHIVEHIEEYNADGVDVSYSDAATDQDKKLFGAFLDELHATLVPTTRLFVTVNPQTSYANRYDVDALQRNADFIIVQGHLFHSSSNFFTGHHTPLFIDLTRLNNPNNTIEGAMKYWVNGGVPHAKLVVGLTAKGLSQGMVFTRNDLSTAIGDTTKPILRPGRSNSPAITQSEVCELMSKNSTKTSFIHDLGVPFLIFGEEFVAYDDEKSMQVKTVWASKFGGIAMYAMDMDNVDGECPHNNSFHLLKTIYATQVCEMCHLNSDARGVVEEAKSSSVAEPVADDDPDEADESAAFMFVRRRQSANSGLRRRYKRATASTATVACERAERRNNFSVICNYRLPDYASSWIRTTQSSDRRLTLVDVPSGKCDEIVVEEAVLFANGSVRYQQQLTATAAVLDDEGSGAEKDAPDVEELLAAVPTMVSSGSRVVSSVRCAIDMNDNDFLSIIGTGEARHQLVTSIVKHLRRYSFVGVELRCDHMIRADTAKRDAFSAFLTQLHDMLSKENQGNEDALDTEEEEDLVEFEQKDNGEADKSGGNLDSAESERSSRQRPLDGDDDDEKSENNQCSTLARSTISIRVPVWRTDISSNYDIDILNAKVHHITMEASIPSVDAQHVAAAATAASSLNAGGRRPSPLRNPQVLRQVDEPVSALADPLFNAAPTGKRMSLTDAARVPFRFRNFAISASVSEWLRIGVKRSRIVVQLVAHGHLFTNKTAIAELSAIVPSAVGATAGAGVDGFGGMFAGVRLPVAVRGPAENDVIMLSGRPLEVEALGRDAVCEIVLSSGTRLHTLYEFVVEMAKTKNDEQLSYESVETVAYKTRYAMRENLAGVALSTLEQDASENFCNEEGEYQLLTSIHHAAKCG